MRELFIITNDECQLVAIYTSKDKALEKVKSYQQVELWQSNDSDSFEYKGEIVA